MGLSQVTGDSSNSLILWLLHTVTKAGLARLVFEEWALHHHRPERLAALQMRKLRGPEISSAEYKHQVLAIGLTSGAVRIYQPAGQVRGGVFRISKFSITVFVTESKVRRCCVLSEI